MKDKKKDERKKKKGKTHNKILGRKKGGAGTEKKDSMTARND